MSLNKLSNVFINMQINEQTAYKVKHFWIQQTWFAYM